MKQGKPRESRRQAIMRELKTGGPRDAAEVAGTLGITPMGVRQHLYEMQAEGLVDFDLQPGPVGRPKKLWRLTPAAEDFFPDGHAALNAELLGAMQQAFGDEGLDQLIESRTKQQITSYRRHLKPADTLEKRVEGLAEIRSREGYMAAAEKGPDGEFLLVENHCPICAAARACSGLCAGELKLFRKVLGKDVEVERTDHILAGARRCAYRIRPKS